MKAAVVVFPGSNCDRDAARALERVTGAKTLMLWHRESTLPAVDLVLLPGGFSYGDYLRSGAIAARSPIMAPIVRAARRGLPVLGICNGFQILTETGLLPGALMRNESLRFVCRDTFLRIERTDPLFTAPYRQGEVLRIPVAHKDGNYIADSETLDRLEGEGLIAFRYCDAGGEVTPEANPNGAARNIAGIRNARGNVLGMMPHPERHVDAAAGGTDGRAMFEGLARVLS